MQKETGRIIKIRKIFVIIRLRKQKLIIIKIHFNGTWVIQKRFGNP